MPVTRFEAEQGQTVRLRIRFELNDSLFDPFSFERVEIHQRTDTLTTELIATIDASEVVQEAQGIFYVDWSIPIDQDPGAYIDRWYYVLDSGDPELFDDASFAVFAAGAFGGAGYISVGEVRSDYLINSPLSDTQIQTLIDQATELVYYGTGRNFASPSETIQVDGTGEQWLILPEPALEVTGIVASNPGTSDITLDPDDFVIKGRWLVHKNYVPYPGTHAWDSCTLCGCEGGATFPFGHRNIAVTGRFGLYQNVPLLITRAAGLWCKYAGADGTIAAPAAANHDSESTELHTWSRKATDAIVQVHLRGHTGIYEIDHILNLFRATTVRMMVI